MVRTHHALQQILALDPERDNHRIVYLTGFYEFPFDYTRATEFALFRTFAVPSISRLLDQTGEFYQRAQKRYDDTDLLLSEISENGYDSERGRAALRRMNQIHGRFRGQISNDDNLYVLSTFIYEPIRWITRYGWRPLVEHERLALYYYCREVGRRMGIKDIPETSEAYEHFNIDYERAHFRYSDSNHRVGMATRDLFLGWFLPKPLWNLGAPAIYAFMDPPLLEAFGFPLPPTAIRALVTSSLRMRSRLVRHLPERKEPALRTPRKRRKSYPHGYTLEQIGPAGSHITRALSDAPGHPEPGEELPGKSLMRVAMLLCTLSRAMYPHAAGWEPGTKEERMRRVQQWWMTGVSPWVKAVYLVLLANGVPAFCILMSIPGRTEEFFVWTMNLEASARMLGVMYTNALLLVILGFMQPDWPRARITLTVIAPFSVAATIVTFLNIAPFLKHPWYHLTYWLTTYLILFFAAPIVFIAQERVHGGKLPILMPVMPLARAYATCAAIATGVTGIGLLIGPRVMNHVWPWTLTPLVSRMLGVWFCTLALAHAWALWDGDWQRTRIIFWQAIPTGILMALVPIIHHDDLRGGRGPLALYLVLALGAAVTALVVTVASVRQDGRLPRAPGVVGEMRPERG